MLTQRGRQRSDTKESAIAPVLVIAAGLAGMVMPEGMAAQEGPVPPALTTNQTYIEAVTEQYTLDVNDPIAVFRHVLSGLPGRVRVYPSENYYYFRFAHAGLEYAGNFQLSILDRDDGVVHFVYGRTLAGWQSKAQQEWLRYRRFSSRDGVKVERVGRLAYTISHAGRTVRFELNDLSRERPPQGLLRPGEIFIGPVFDESGFQFWLTFNRAANAFLYLLNEMKTVPDRLEASAISDRIMVGMRSGFAFYKDQPTGKGHERKILIGVFADNADNNTYLDGPFDQIPDNFLVGEILRTAILSQYPDLKGKIDRFGHLLPARNARHAIIPYMQYHKLSELSAIVECAKSHQGTRYYRCFDLNAGVPGSHDIKK